MSKDQRADELIRTEITGEICYVTLSSPQNLNAMDCEMVRALRDVCTPVLQNAAIKIVVFSGAGRAFCAGGDLLYISGFVGRTQVALDNILDPLHGFLELMDASDKIIIFSVHGVVAGAGLSLVSMGDFCIAEEDTTFVPAYASIGLTPDAGGSIGLTRSVGRRNALRLLLAEDRFDVETALETGLVTNIASPGTLKEATSQFAERLAALPQVSLAGTKRLLRQAPDTAVPEQLQREKAQLARAMEEPAFQDRLSKIKDNGGVA